MNPFNPFLPPPPWCCPFFWGAAIANQWLADTKRRHMREQDAAWRNAQEAARQARQRAWRHDMDVGATVDGRLVTASLCGPEARR